MEISEHTKMLMHYMQKHNFDIETMLGLALMTKDNDDWQDELTVFIEETNATEEQAILKVLQMKQRDSQTSE